MKLLIGGDFSPQHRVGYSIEKGDYSCFENLKPIINQADYSILNLESPVVVGEATPIQKTGPALSTTINAIKCIKDAGFSCITLANNHLRDYGAKGIEDTIKQCEAYGLDYVGAGINLQEAKRIHNIVIGDRKVSIINVCESEWSVANNFRGGSNPYNIVNLYNDIISSRKDGSDYVVVIVHGGIEHYPYPTPRMKEDYHFLIDVGADLVVNHHQHCISGYEIYKERFIFYGIGNLCFDSNVKTRTPWNEGFLVMIDFDNSYSFTLYPYVQCINDGKVHLVDNDDSLHERIQELSKVIEDQDMLFNQFNNYSELGGKERMLMLEPYSNRALQYLFKKGFLPRILSEKWDRLALNLFRCESHREVILEYLENSIKK